MNIHPICYFDMTQQEIETFLLQVSQRQLQ
jgi:hypothetical protein